MQFEELKIKITESLKKDSLKQSFELLFNSIASNNEYYSELIVNNAHFQRIEKAYRQNIIDWETMSRNKNSVIKSLVSVMEELENELNPQMKFSLHEFGAQNFAYIKFELNDKINDKAKEIFKEFSKEDIQDLMKVLSDKLENADEVKDENNENKNNEEKTSKEKQPHEGITPTDDVKGPAFIPINKTIMFQKLEDINDQLHHANSDKIHKPEKLKDIFSKFKPNVKTSLNLENQLNIALKTLEEMVVKK